MRTAGALGWALAVLWAWGCDGASEGGGGDSGVAEACRQSDLIAQCPPGSNPILGETAAGLCSGGADLRNMSGAVTGRCFGSGQCVVACQFAAACACGVESVTREGVVCVTCAGNDACGDGRCAAGEDPQTCPQDCAGECSPNALRCQGEAVESCNLRGRWEAIACPRGEACTEVDGPARCRRQDVIGGGDAGVADAGGPRISGRLLLGDADYPGSGSVAQPGDGRNLTRVGRFGLNRACQGNAAEVARCREQIVSRPRDELVNHRPAEVQVSIEADHLRLWGTHRVAALGFDGLGPDFGDRLPIETFCPPYAERCLGQPGACADGVPEAVQMAYESWAYGSSSMACWLDEAACVPNSDCQLAGRLFGYDPDRVVARPDAGALSPDGRRFAFWLDERQVALFDVDTQQVIPLGTTGSYAFNLAPGNLAFSGDGAFVAATAVSGEQYDADTLLVVWPAAGGEPVAALPLEDVWPASVALSPNGRVAAVTRRNPPGNPRIEPAGIDVIDVTTSTLMFRILPAEEPNPPGLNCFSHLNGGLAFSPAGDLLAAGAQMIGGLGCNGAAVVEVWRLATGEKVQTLPGTTRHAVDRVAFSPDGSTLAVASRLSQAPADLIFDLSLWDVATGALVQRLESLATAEQTSAMGLRYGDGGRGLVVWGGGTGGDDYTSAHIAVYRQVAP